MTSTSDASCSRHPSRCHPADGPQAAKVHQRHVENLKGESNDREDKNAVCGLQAVRI